MTRKCWTQQCDRDAVEGVRTEGVIDQTWGRQPGMVYACTCHWTRIDPVEPRPRDTASELHSNGWTASVSPCSEGDVDAR